MVGAAGEGEGGEQCFFFFFLSTLSLVKMLDRSK